MTSPFSPLISLTALTALATVLLGACASAPKHNDMLEQARSAVTGAERNPQVAGDARTDLTTAQEALKNGDALLKAGKPVADVNHQAYLAERFALAAQKGADLAATEKAIADANNRRNSVLLAARERDAALATEVARTKTAEAAAATSDALNSARLADISARESAAAQLRSSELTAQNDAAQQRARDLETALADLQAKKTDRGLVITLGDVLFATGQADLKSGSRRSLDKLSTFLHQYPARNVRIEGFTDSVGSSEYNQALSERRAGAVRDALTGMGVANERIQVRGYGKDSPVADNASATGRQQNRRVEVIILDEGTERAVAR